MVRLIVFGACGKMGTRILDLASQNPDIQIAGALEMPNHPMLGQKILNGKATVTSDLNALKGQADAVIDFTAPEATLDHLKTLSGWGNVAAVVGTTGLSAAQQAEVKKVSEKIPVVFSPNMSVGVNLLFDVVRMIAKKIPGYDIEIIETHHNQKKDAPSGTALGLAKEITEELNRSLENDLVHGRKGQTGARTAKEIGMHAVRAGDVVGDHTVIFATQGERIEVTHRASSRDAFAAGAVRAALWTRGQKPGLYSMKDVLKA